MRSYVVQQGDHLAKIAARFGVSTDAIWSLPQNEELRGTRDPHMLAPGDIVRIPSRPDSAMRYSANVENRFRATVPTTSLNLVFFIVGEAICDEDYEVHGMGRVVTGRTDGFGQTSLQVRADVDALEIRFAKPALTFTLQIGHLDPAETELGAAQRLARLRYMYIPRGANKTRLKLRLRRAVGLFQKAEGLPATGELDQVTCDRLKARAGF